MKVLYILQEVPYPPDNGIRWKTYNLISYMAQRHDCEILTFGTPSESEKLQRWVSSFPRLNLKGVFPRVTGWRLFLGRIRDLLNSRPPSLARYETRQFRATLKELLYETEYDVIHYDQFNLAQYLDSSSRTPSVMSPNDSISMLYFRRAEAAGNRLKKMVFNFIARKIRSYETQEYPKFTKVHLVSTVDADVMHHQVPDADIEVIGIAVDPAFLEKSQNRVPGPVEAQSVLSVCNLDRDEMADPIINFVKNDLPRVRQVYSDLRFKVVGRIIPAAIGNYLNGIPGVEAVSWVDDYVATVASSDIVMFLESAGSGVKNRVLQALAAGKPVIGTPIAFEGLDVIDGQNAFVVSGSGGAADILLALLGDPELRMSVGDEARDLVCRNYTVDVIGRRWERLYQSAIEAFHRGANDEKG